MQEKFYLMELQSNLLALAKKFKATVIFLAVSVILIATESFFGFDAFEATLNYSSKLTSICLTVIHFFVIGMIFDCIRHVSTKKDLEKNVVYRQTIFELNHLMRNLQSKFIIINNSESTRNEFGKETVSLLNQSSKDIEEILDKLALLDDVTPESIKKICRSSEN
jgi:ABC-type protease/lipase transport system fused ATPase/permease subunit